MPLRYKLLIPAALVAGTVLAAASGKLARFEPGEDLPGGVAATIDDHGKNAFSLPAPALSDAQKTDFVIGNSFFKKAWVEAPSSTAARDGLGPHFIARSCGACHTLDGRGAPPTITKGLQDEQPMALLIRLSIPGSDAHGGPMPEPTYGGQFNNDAIPDVTPEGKVQIRYRELPGTFADGSRYSLRAPTYTLTELGYGALHRDVQLSPRIAPHMVGLGLLEAIKVDDVLANAARQAAENKGIKGEPNWVWDAYAQKTVLGRYGWKGNVGSVAHQASGAFLGDIGITSRHFPNEECTAAQKDCLAAPTGGKPEIEDRKLEQVILYSQALAVPSRRNPKDAAVLRGKQVFADALCVSCHVQSYTTGPHPTLPKLSGQKIWPYTDLLLHDMGEGLADHRPDYKASGRQWKTPPLWGLGLVPTVNGHSHYLHDGRARNLMEAVLWHGGEAEASKQYVLKLNKQDRDNLVRFLQSL
ncbi:di-heme oxidoreductase family protein [Chitinolyticbacter albus]|uniref:di-heme oxidoreductase family protein n=1 Tax=Chitinolyticbacter albus TaxID=2961951 RepID=UPI00210DAB1A|nr:di-heme oxidoredictase family protein [Chitinolyticbacter albus]